MTTLRATVVLPTTGDRGTILPYSVASVLAQTVRELELFIIGDGVTEATRRVIRELMDQDDRIRFFDHPKHPRRGEVYRHAALAGARGEIVAYLCDRDLWLPEHLATVLDELGRYDLVATAHYYVSRDQRLTYGGGTVPFGDLADIPLRDKRLMGFQLSAVGHTLAAYRALPHGWRTTPREQATDRYMWRQFAQLPGLRARALAVPTFLYFKRGSHPGWPTARRREELVRWAARLGRSGERGRLAEEALRNSLNERRRLYLRLRSPLLIWGRPPLDFVRSFPRRAASRLKNLTGRPQW